MEDASIPQTELQKFKSAIEAKLEEFDKLGVAVTACQKDIAGLKTQIAAMEKKLPTASFNEPLCPHKDPGEELHDLQIDLDRQSKELTPLARRILDGCLEPPDPCG